MLSYADKTVVLTVPVSCAGAEDEIDIKATLELTAVLEDGDVWIDAVRKECGERAHCADALYGAAEAWLMRNYDDVLKEFN